MAIINVADYTRVPGPRFREEGPHSGEDFRETILVPAFRAAQKNGERLAIALDGMTFGYPTSFLEEAFGGLARQLGINVVRRGLMFISQEEPMLEKEIFSYIDNAERTSKERQERQHREVTA